MAAYEINLKRKLTLQSNRENNIIMLVKCIRRYFEIIKEGNSQPFIIRRLVKDEL